MSLALLRDDFIRAACDFNRTGESQHTFILFFEVFQTVRGYLSDLQFKVFHTVAQVATHRKSRDFNKVFNNSEKVVICCSIIVIYCDLFFLNCQIKRNALLKKSS